MLGNRPAKLTWLGSRLRSICWRQGVINEPPAKHVGEHVGALLPMLTKIYWHLLTCQLVETCARVYHLIQLFRLMACSSGLHVNLDLAGAQASSSGRALVQVRSWLTCLIGRLQKESFARPLEARIRSARLSHSYTICFLANIDQEEILSRRSHSAS